MRVDEAELTTVDAIDLAVVLERAERRVDPAQPVEHRVHDTVGDLVVTQVEEDRQPHDVLDATKAGRRRTDYHRFSARIAAWSDCANASLV